jgi:hypothetical protein
MADVTLSDGRELDINLNRITLREWRALFDTDQKPEDEDATLSKVVDLTVEEYQSLPYLDFRLVAQAIFTKAREPLASPN